MRRPREAVMREAAEETGLRDLELVRFLGEDRHDARPYGKDEMHHRYFFHLRCTAEPPETWRHYEVDPYDLDNREPPLFEFFWGALPDEIPPLVEDHGAMIDELMKSLAILPNEPAGVAI